MNGRELFTAIFAGEKVDRLPPPGIGPWGQTLQRWHGEGLGEGEDFYRKLGFKWDERATLPLNLNMAPTFEVKVLARDDRYVTLVDEYGVTKKMIRDDFERSGGLKSNAGATSGMSQWLDFPVKDLRTWKELRESRFRSDNIRDRLPDDWFNGGRERHVEHAQTRWVEYFVFPLVGFFGPMRELMGLEGLVFAMADQPGLVHTIVGDLADYWLACFGQVLRDGVRVDMFCFFEDMCATKGPLIGPAMFREFLAPGYRRVIGGLREMGVKQFFVDSDGNLQPLIAEAHRLRRDRHRPVRGQLGHGGRPAPPRLAGTAPPGRHRQAGTGQGVYRDRPRTGALLPHRLGRRPLRAQPRPRHSARCVMGQHVPFRPGVPEVEQETVGSGP